MRTPRWCSFCRDGTFLQGDNPDSTTTDFVNVDGGTVNNEPLDMVRMALAGLNARNKRPGDQADRAVILIAPFSDPVSLGPSVPPPMIELAMPFIMSLVYQSRFKPADIALANAESVYSRFLIAPVGPGPDNTRVEGKSAIAAGGLGGFLGFVDSSFLHYDYMLGRRNAFEFLSKHFVFPEVNPIFEQLTEPQRQDQRVVDANGTRYLRMIPIVEGLTEPPPLSGSQWPKLNQFPAELPGAIEGRLDAVYDLLMKATSPSSWWKRAVTSIYVGLGWKLAIRGALRDAATEIVRSGLKKQGLL